MKHLLTSLFGRVTLGLFAMPVMAQVLTTEGHTPYRSDSLLAYKLPYVNVVDSGLNCIWDFSNLPLDSAELITMDHYTPAGDTSLIGLHREHANYYYRCERDTLWLSGYETSKTRIHYTNPIGIYAFPLTYHDTIVTSYEGHGKYCNLVPYIVEGKSFTQCDAIGQLKLPDITLDSALRIHTEQRYIARAYDTICVMTNHYRWYDKAIRYPLFETCKIVTIGQTDTLEISSSYYIPQEIDNEGEQRNDRQSKPAIAEEPIVTSISCVPNPVHSDLHISYRLVREADVYASVHFNGGSLLYSTSIQHQEEGTHNLTIDMAAYPAGTYVVYLHADGMVDVRTIIKF